MAAQKIDEAFIELLLRDKKFKAGMKGAQKQMKSFGETIQSTAKILGGLFVGGMAINALRGFIELSRVQARAEAKLAAVIKATGGAAGKSAGELKAYASSLQDLTGIGDEAIINMQALLATFKNIKGDTFDEATRAVLDMSAALGQDLKGSAIQLGKALNDPIRGVTALRKVGVSFTDQQLEMIKAMVEANDILGAQTLILRELQSEFGGAAEAVATSVDKMAASWGDLKEQVGGAALAMADSVVNFELFAAQLKALRGGPKGIFNALYDRAAANMARRTGQTIITPRAGVAPPPAPTPSILPGSRGPMSAAERRDAVNNTQNPGGPLFKPSFENIGGQGIAALNAILGGIQQALPTSAQTARARAIAGGLQEPSGGSDMARFFGLGGFSKALQESIGKPDEQKKRDEARDGLLTSANTLAGQMLEELKAGAVAVFAGAGGNT